MKNGDQIPLLGLGTWQSAPGEVGEVIKNAIEVGYRHIDCAAIYGNEAEIGESLSEVLSAGKVARKDLWITSKLWNNAHRKNDVRPALEKTLSDLKLDYLDLYLIHWPVVFESGVGFPSKAEEYLPLSEVPISETWVEMEKLLTEGLVRHIGVSNFSVKKLKEMSEYAQVMPEVNQIELHPLLQQKEMHTYCKDTGIHLTAYSPLGSRGRSESMKKASEPNMLTNETIQKIAQERGCSTAQVILSWSVCRGTSVIPKSSNLGRMKENLAAADIELSENEMQSIGTLDEHYRYIDGKFWEIKNGPYTAASVWDE